MHTFLIAALSLDGFIAQNPDQVSTAWTSKEDKQFFSRRTKEAGVMVLGSATFLTFKRMLPGRAMIIYTRDVEKFRQTLKEQEISLDVIELSVETEALRQDVLYATSLSPKELVADLEKRGCKELAVCGGSSIYTQFLQAKCLDTLLLTIEPTVFGKGVPLFNDTAFSTLHLTKTENLSDQTLLLEYRVDNG